MLATNSINIVLVGEGPDGKPTKLESFRLVGDKDAFNRDFDQPWRFARAFTGEATVGLGEYLVSAALSCGVMGAPSSVRTHMASVARCTDIFK